MSRCGECGAGQCDRSEYRQSRSGVVFFFSFFLLLYLDRRSRGPVVLNAWFQSPVVASRNLEQTERVEFDWTFSTSYDGHIEHRGVISEQPGFPSDDLREEPSSATPGDAPQFSWQRADAANVEHQIDWDLLRQQVVTSMATPVAASAQASYR